MIYFVPGMHIEEGMRYTDGIRRYIADPVPGRR